MLIHFVLLLLFTLANLVSAQTFSDFLSRVNSAPAQERPAIVDSFLQAVPGFPFIEPTYQVHYLYFGAANSVTIPGDANQWNPSSFPMNRISSTDLWYHSRYFESDARLDYKFVLNNSNWILDPRNPYTVNGGFGPNSELRMPDFVQPPEIEFYPEIAHGALRDSVFFSQHMGNSRRVRIYTPPAYDPDGDCYPLLVVHDGLEYISLARTERILDYLIHHNQIQPLIAVFVPPVNRTEEYAGNLQQNFGRFITEELLPWVDDAYNTCAVPAKRGTAGASNGGNIALWLGVTYPEVFGLVGAQSSNVQSSISNTLAANADLGLKFYLDIGSYDIGVLIPLVQNLHQILQNQGYPVFYQLHHDGHSWGNWRAHLDECLTYLYPSETFVDPATAPVIRTTQLAQNYPNPFNPSTKIFFTLEHRQRARLTVFDIQGRTVDTLANGVLESGNYEFVFNGADFPSGVYFARLTTGSDSQTIKMMLLK